MTIRTRFFRFKFRGMYLALVFAITLALTAIPALADEYTLKSDIGNRADWCDADNWSSSTGTSFPYQPDDTAILKRTATLLLNAPAGNLQLGTCDVTNDAIMTLELQNNVGPVINNLNVTKGSLAVTGSGSLCTGINVTDKGELELRYIGDLKAPNGTDAAILVNSGSLTIAGPTFISSVSKPAKIDNYGKFSLGSLGANGAYLNVTARGGSVLTFTGSFNGDLTLNQLGASSIILQTLAKVNSVNIQGNDEALNIQGAGTLTAKASSATIALGSGRTDTPVLNLTSANETKVNVRKGAVLTLPLQGSSTNTISKTNVTLSGGATLETAGWGAVLDDSNVSFEAANAILQLTGTPGTSLPALTVNGTVSVPDGLTITLAQTTSDLLTSETWVPILRAQALNGITNTTINDKISLSGVAGGFELRLNASGNTRTIEIRKSATVYSNYAEAGGYFSFDSLSGKNLIKFDSKPTKNLTFTVSNWKVGSDTITLEANEIQGVVKRGGILESYSCRVDSKNIGYSVQCIIPVTPTSEIDDNDAFEFYFTANHEGKLISIPGYYVVVGAGAVNGTLSVNTDASDSDITVTESNEISVPSNTTVAFDILWEDCFKAVRPETNLTAGRDGPSVTIKSEDSTGSLKFTSTGTYEVMASASYDGVEGRANTIIVRVTGEERPQNQFGGGGGGCSTGLGITALALALALPLILKRKH